VKVCTSSPIRRTARRTSKAPIELTVDAPADWTVWANGQAVPGGGSGQAGRFAFAPTRPISTFLMTVVAGPYHARYDSHDGIPLGLLARRSLASVLDANAEEILEVTRAALDWYHDTFGIRYPSYAIQPSTLSLAERLLSGDELDDNLRRVLVDKTDELRIALAARKAAGG
jgi:hypothetical protein